MREDGPERTDLRVPPFAIEDSLGRRITLRPHEPGDRAAVEAFYEAFDPADRAQGIPPAGPEARKRWLEVVLRGPSVLAVDAEGERVVGHAGLVDDLRGSHELVVFVLQGYRGTGIGTALVRALLGLGRALELGRVWLTVQRWNHPAIAVYRKTGFERVGEEGLELIMARSVAPGVPAG